MPELLVSPIYAAAIAVLMAVLSTTVGVQRGRYSVALGDGGVSGLALTIRRFGNLSEYAAMAVLLLVIMELRGVSAVWLHAYGGTLLVLRLVHPFILFDSMEAPLWKKMGRFIAAAGTALLLVIGGVAVVLA